MNGERSSRQWLSYRTIWALIVGAQTWTIVFISIGFALVLAFTQAAGPLLTQYLIDHVLLPKHVSDLVVIGWAIVGIGAMQIGASVGQVMVLERIIQRQVRRLRSEWVWARLTRTDSDPSANPDAAPMTSRLLADLNALAHVTVTIIMTVPGHVLWVALVGALMVHQSAGLTGVALGLVPAVVAAEWWLARLQGRWTIRWQTDMAAATATVLETFQLERISRALAAPQYALRRSAASLDRLEIDAVRRATWLGLGQALSTLLSFLGPLMLLVYGSLMVLRGTLSLGALIAFYAFAMQVYIPIRGLLRTPSYLNRMQALAAGLQANFGNPAEVQALVQPQRLLGPLQAPQVTLRNVSLVAGQPAHVVVDGLSMRLKRDDRLWIRGPNGVGKSYLLNVIGGLTVPCGGRVEIKGTVGWSLHPPQISDDTLWNNIVWGRPRINMQKAEHILDTLGRGLGQWSDGWETRLDPKSGAVSDGTKQVVALTRALAAEPTIVLLDEPFVYLDTIAVHGLMTLMVSWNGILVFCHHGQLPAEILSVTSVLDLPHIAQAAEDLCVSHPIVGKN